MRLATTFALVALTAASAASAQEQRADLVLVNGRVLTANGGTYLSA